MRQDFKGIYALSEKLASEILATVAGSAYFILCRLTLFKAKTPCKKKGELFQPPAQAGFIQKALQQPGQPLGPGSRGRSPCCWGVAAPKASTIKGPGPPGPSSACSQHRPRGFSPTLTKAWEQHSRPGTPAPVLSQQAGTGMK